MIILGHRSACQVGVHSCDSGSVLTRIDPDAAILLEPSARNTGQNITLSREVLAAAGITPSTVLLISMPYMERRSFATARKLWPEVEVICASEPLEFDDYLKRIGDAKLVTDQLVGDLQRVLEYPKLGFAIDQDPGAFGRQLRSTKGCRLPRRAANRPWPTCGSPSPEALHVPGTHPATEGTPTGCVHPSRP